MNEPKKLIPPFGLLGTNPYFGSLFTKLQYAEKPGGSELGLTTMLFSLVVSTRARRVLEVGRLDGFSALAITSGFYLLDEGFGSVVAPCFKERPDVDYVAHLAPQERILYSVEHNPRPTAEALLAERGLWSRYVRPIHGKSLEVPIPNEPLDLLFIDGDHGYEPCRRDVERYAPHLKPRGFMVLHDYFGFYEGGAENRSDVRKVILELEPAWRAVLVDTGFPSFCLLQKGPLP
jgi:hypothetical protein